MGCAPEKRSLVLVCFRSSVEHDTRQWMEQGPWNELPKSRGTIKRVLDSGLKRTEDVSLERMNRADGLASEDSNSRSNNDCPQLSNGKVTQLPPGKRFEVQLWNRTELSPSSAAQRTT